MTTTDHLLQPNQLTECQLSTSSEPGIRLQVLDRYFVVLWAWECSTHCTDEKSMGGGTAKREGKGNTQGRGPWGPSMYDFSPQALEPDVLSLVLSLATLSCVVSLELLLHMENEIINSFCQGQSLSVSSPTTSLFPFLTTDPSSDLGLGATYPASGGVGQKPIMAILLLFAIHPLSSPLLAVRGDQKVI